MILRDIMLDLPYVENKVYTKRLQDECGLSHVDAMWRDNSDNWKWRRRKFSNQSRCVASMISRLLEQSKNEADCWRIIIDCYDLADAPRNYLQDGKYPVGVGVCHVPVKTDIDRFFASGPEEQKRQALEIIQSGLDLLEGHSDIPLEPIREACRKVVEADYKNEWLWSKPHWLGGRAIQLKVRHEPDAVTFSVVLSNKKDGVLEEREILGGIEPNEWIFVNYMGKLKWLSKTEAALIAKDGSTVWSGVL